MPKTSVSAKILELGELYVQRMETNLRGEKPNVAVYWATMLHSLFILSSAMTADRQMDKEVLSGINDLHDRGMKILKNIGPLSDSSMEGSRRRDECLGYMLDAYDRFVQEAQMLGLF